MKVSEQQCRAWMDQAEKLVGHNPPDNFSIGDLTSHINSLGNEALPLAHVLGSPKVRDDFEAYEHYDKEAGIWQDKFKSLYRIAFLLMMATLVASIVILVWPLTPMQTAFYWPLAMFVLVVTLFISLLVAWHLGSRGHYEKWQENRGNAEYLRRKHFENLFDVETKDTANQLPTLLLKLHYVRRYQLELQEAYHTVRGGQHERKAALSKFLLYPGLALSVLLMVLLGFSFYAAWLDQGLPWEGVPPGLIEYSSWTEYVEFVKLDTIGLVAVFVTSLAYGFMMIITRLDGNVRNAARYAVVRENIKYLLGDEFDEAARAACQNNEHDVHRFINKVHGVMANEQADWVRLANLDCGIETGASDTTEPVRPEPAQVPSSTG